MTPASPAGSQNRSLSRNRPFMTASCSESSCRTGACMPAAGGCRIQCRKQKCRRPAPGADRRHIPQGRAFTARPGCAYTRKSLTVLKPLFRSLPCVVLLLSLGKDTLVSCIVKLLLELGNLCLDVLGTECTELKGLSVLFKEVHAGRIGSINA